MNRHYPSSMVEVWDSWEHIFKDKLESLDHMARQMYKDLTYTRSANPEKIREFMQQMFAELWNEVAQEQEDANGKASSPRRPAKRQSSVS